MEKKVMLVIRDSDEIPIYVGEPKRSWLGDIVRDDRGMPLSADGVTRPVDGTASLETVLFDEEIGEYHMALSSGY